MPHIGTGRAWTEISALSIYHTRGLEMLTQPIDRALTELGNPSLGNSQLVCDMHEWDVMVVMHPQDQGLPVRKLLHSTERPRAAVAAGRCR